MAMKMDLGLPPPNQGQKGFKTLMGRIRSVVDSPGWSMGEEDIQGPALAVRIPPKPWENPEGPAAHLPLRVLIPTLFGIPTAST
jgi:hypothetical protein